MEIKASLNYLRMSPRKVRLPASLIKGKTAEEAERELRFLNKRAALPLLKLLHSAVANASHNFNLSKENLRVLSITVDGGPALKRIRPRAMGRAVFIRKRTSHVTLVLSEISGSARKRRKIKAAKPVLRRESAADEPRAEEKRAPSPRPAEKLAPKKKAASIVRRVFRRKAI